MPDVICPVDGTRFHIPPSQLARTHGKPTCSPECKKKYRVGPRHWNYKGGYVDAAGYRRVSVDGRYVLEHRLVLERKLGRKLRPNERVRWKNGNRQDNRLRNLTVERVVRRRLH